MLRRVHQLIQDGNPLHLAFGMCHRERQTRNFDLEPRRTAEGNRAAWQHSSPDHSRLNGYKPSFPKRVLRSIAPTDKPTQSGFLRLLATIFLEHPGRRVCKLFRMLTANSPDGP